MNIEAHLCLQTKQTHRPLGVFEHPFLCKMGKIKGGPFGDIQKICEKSHKAEKTCTKIFWSWAGLEPVLLLGRPQKK